jgi:hypothetical protein
MITIAPKQYNGKWIVITPKGKMYKVSMYSVVRIYTLGINCK